MNSSNVWNETFSEISNGGFLARILEVAYDSSRFKKYAQDIRHTKKLNQDAACEMIGQAASKMTVQGVIAGLPGGLLELAIGAVDVASLLYHTVEMCGVLVEIYGLDTSKDEVKALVLAGASGDDNAIDKVLNIMFVGNITNDIIAASLVKSVVAPILEALGVKVGIREGLKIASIIPIIGGIVDGSTNSWMVNDTGYKFLNKLKLINSKF